MHTGQRIIEKGQRGEVLVLCPMRHLIHVVPKGEWAGSIWEAYAHDEVTCDGAEPAEEATR